MEIIKIPKKEGIIDRTTGKVLNRKLRVAAYARVSTMGAEQLNSYESQKKYYYEKINNNPEWQYVDIYADEGISGTVSAKREDFQRMLRDCRKGKIDRIYTKSISRFARNTKDCLQYIRELRTLGVSVYFEKENIDTGRITDEMMLMCFFDQKRLNALLAFFSETGLKRIALKAMLTPTNLSWSACELHRNLSAEHEQFQRMKKG